jgi:cell pole-organizing protein PopZ
MELDSPPPQQAPPLADLAAAIRLAAEAAAALSAPSSSAAAAAAAATLRDAHAAIGSFLSRLDAPAALPSDNDQPMADGSEPGGPVIGEVEDRLRHCALQGNKRRKRPVPPSWPLGRRSSGACLGREATESVLDVEGRRGAAMDLLLQFHA